MIYYDKYATEREMAKSGVSWFKFDEPSGNVTDSKGTAVGTVTGATRVTGISGNALNFNGTSDFVQFPSIVVPIGRKSIRFKMKSSTNGIYQMIMTQTGGSANHGTQVSINIDGTLVVAIGKAVSGTPIFSLTSNKIVNDNQWHDVLFTWDGTMTANQAKLYIDDMSTPNVTGTANVLQTVAPTYNLRIGRGQVVADPFWFKGQLDELEIYNDVINTTSNKSFILSDNNAYAHDGLAWVNKGIIPTGETEKKDFYFANGMNEITKEQLQTVAASIPGGIGRVSITKF